MNSLTRNQERHTAAEPYDTDLLESVSPFNFTSSYSFIFYDQAVGPSHFFRFLFKSPLSSCFSVIVPLQDKDLSFISNNDFESVEFIRIRTSLINGKVVLYSSSYPNQNAISGQN